jgi:hypothetical protein
MNLMHGMGGAPRIRLRYKRLSDLMISWLSDFCMPDASEEQELESKRMTVTESIVRCWQRTQISRGRRGEGNTISELAGTL